MENNILSKIEQIPFGNYIKTKTPKTQVVLHHTVSGGSAIAVAHYWARLKNKVGTCIIIDKAGIPHQLFSSRYWAGHIGGHSTMDREFDKFELPYRNTSKNSIGVELIAWGGLEKKEDKYYNYYGREHKGPISTLEAPYRGYKYYDPYTPEQIAILKGLLYYWNRVYNIPLTYNDNMWDVNEEALSNRKGIWSHTSFRSDKSDLFPQEELLLMLKNL